MRIHIQVAERYGKKMDQHFIVVLEIRRPATEIECSVQLAELRTICHAPAPKMHLFGLRLPCPAGYDVIDIEYRRRKMTYPCRCIFFAHSLPLIGELEGPWQGSKQAEGAGLQLESRRYYSPRDAPGSLPNRFCEKDSKMLWGI
jgi:hypothetical protein